MDKTKDRPKLKDIIEDLRECRLTLERARYAGADPDRVPEHLSPPPRDLGDE